MILLYNSTPNANILNVVRGVESELMLDIHGHISIDITPVIAACDKSKPIVLNFIRTQSEINTLNNLKAINIPYPFFAPMVVIGPNDKLDTLINSADKANTDMPQVKVKTKQPDKVILRTGKCLSCGANDVELITIPGVRQICANCYKLNMKLLDAKVKKPDKGKAEINNKTGSQ